MTMRLQQAYDALENNREATQKVASNPMSPYQGIAQIAKQYQNTAGQTPTPVPMQSVLQQQAAQQQQQPQPQGFAAGDKVEARSPQAMIDQVITKVVGPGLKAYPDIYAAMERAVNNMLANNGQMDPRAIKAVIAQIERNITPQNRAQMMQFENKLHEALAGNGVPLLPVRRADGGDVPTMNVPADDSAIAYAEGDEVQAPEEEEPVLPGAVRDLAALYRNDEFSPQEAGIYGLMQQGQMSRGIGDTIAAALTGAANPDRLARGQESALMAAKARSNTEGGLTALSTSMANRAMEAEGSANKNWNKAVGDVFGAMQKTAENKAQLGIHQLDAKRVLDKAKMEYDFNSEIEKHKEDNRNKRHQEKLELERSKIGPNGDKKSLTSEASRGTLARQRAKEVMKEVSNVMSPLSKHSGVLNFDRLYRHFYENPNGSVEDLIITTP